MNAQPKSSKPRKQRKWLIEAPLNKRQGLVASPLSKELRERYKMRSLGVRKGDKVKVLRGDFKGASGEVTEVDLKDYCIYIAGVNQKKANGTEVPKAIDASKVMIMEPYTEDKERRALLDRKQAKK